MNDQTCDEAVDYRKMYFHLAGAVERAIRLLVTAQQECEDILLDSDVPDTSSESPPRIENFPFSIKKRPPIGGLFYSSSNAPV